MAFEVTQHTSVNTEEFKPEKYVIAFAPELIGFILDEKKMTTYRFGDKYAYIEPGDTVKIQNSTSKELVAAAIITHKATTTFGDLPLTLDTHEAYRDKEHQRTVMSGYYAYLGRQLVDDDPFLIFDFRLLDKE